MDESRTRSVSHEHEACSAEYRTHDEVGCTRRSLSWTEESASLERAKDAQCGRDDFVAVDLAVCLVQVAMELVAVVVLVVA